MAGRVEKCAQVNDGVDQVKAAADRTSEEILRLCVNCPTPAFGAGRRRCILAGLFEHVALGAA
jgi:hypothetical protein